MLGRLENRFSLLTGSAVDVPERHRTLRASIDWSYDLLRPDEQALFRRLAVLPGGWTLGTAEAVCPMVGPLSIDICDGLGSLLDHSLVRREGTEEHGTRFSMLGTLREYGIIRLAESGELEAARQAHATHFLALVEEAEPGLRRPDQARWLRRLETELDNLRAALDWAVRVGGAGGIEAEDLPLGGPAAAETALRMAAALWRFWHLRGYWREGRERLAAALSLPGGSERSRARALNAAGALAHDQGDYRAAATLLKWSVAVARCCDDREAIATAYNNLGHVALDQGHAEDAVESYGQALTLWRELGDTRGIVMAAHNLGCVALDRAQYARATLYLEESLALKREFGDQQAIAVSLNNLGLVMIRQKNPERAAALLTESLRLFQQLDDTYGLARALENLAELAHAEGDLARAVERYRQSLQYDVRLENRETIAGDLEGLGAVLTAQGHALRGGQLFGAAEALRAAAGAPRAESERPRYDENVAVGKATVGVRMWEAVWEKGRAMSPAEAVAFALEETAQSAGPPRSGMSHVAP
jgi:tetratricopeptide (TPR) repeat protein